MEVRYTTGRNEYRRMTTDELRAAFMNTKLCEKGKVNLMYCEVERGIAGFAVPTSKPLALPAGKELASAYFCERRELGVLNIGGEGTVTVDGEKFVLRPHDVLYVGKGAKKVLFASRSAKKPAEFYLASYPAHRACPTKLIRFEDANHRHLGTVEDCNVRTIHQFILPGKCDSCQLVMGFTQLEPGSNWNTMPAHTHGRRVEAYFYFNVPQGNRICHLMGEPQEERLLWLSNEQAVMSPEWSIHAAAGTSNYMFIWGMAGENLDYGDMDKIPYTEMR